jgi:hypothetical protein
MVQCSGIQVLGSGTMSRGTLTGVQGLGISDDGPWSRVYGPVSRVHGPGVQEVRSLGIQELRAPGLRGSGVHWLGVQGPGMNPEP